MRKLWKLLRAKVLRFNVAFFLLGVRGYLFACYNFCQVAKNSYHHPS